jgi:hypothetical protein
MGWRPTNGEVLSLRRMPSTLRDRKKIAKERAMRVPAAGSPCRC